VVLKYEKKQGTGAPTAAFTHTSTAVATDSRHWRLCATDTVKESINDSSRTSSAAVVVFLCPAAIGVGVASPSFSRQCFLDDLLQHKLRAWAQLYIQSEPDRLVAGHYLFLFYIYICIYISILLISICSYVSLYVSISIIFLYISNIYYLLNNIIIILNNITICSSISLYLLSTT
jgi:hypothetical protein